MSLTLVNIGIQRGWIRPAPEPLIDAETEKRLRQKREAMKRFRARNPEYQRHYQRKYRARMKAEQKRRKQVA